MRQPIVITALLTLFAGIASADDTDQRRKVSVTGTAITRTAPDVITWHITITDNDKDLLKAKEQSDTKMTAILELRDELDVEDKDIQTGNMSVRKEYLRDRSGNRTEFRHFAVSRSVTIKQTEVDRFDEYLSRLLTAAEMDVSFSFSSSRFHELRNETRLKALQIAKDKATAMTQTLGSKLGKVISISENHPNFYASPASNAAFVDRGNSAPPDETTGTFAPGAIEIRVSVDVSFEIE